MPKQVATWNSARDVWEIPATEGFFCEHSDVYLEIFPTSGMTLNGVAYELPTWEPAMDGSGSSSLLKTPTTQLAINGGSQHPDKRKAGGHGPTLADEVEHLLPTPAAADSTGGRISKEKGGTRDSGAKRSITLATAIHHDVTLLPTPSACVANDGESTETWLARRERVKLTAVNGNGMGMPLTIASLLIGENTNQQSGDGKSNSEGHLLGQQNLLDEIRDIA